MGVFVNPLNCSGVSMLFLVNPTRNTEGVHVNLMRWTDAYLGEPIGNADGVCVYMVITNGFLSELKN